MNFVKKSTKPFKTPANPSAPKPSATSGDLQSSTKTVVCMLMPRLIRQEKTLTLSETSRGYPPTCFGTDTAMSLKFLSFGILCWAVLLIGTMTRSVRQRCSGICRMRAILLQLWKGANSSKSGFKYSWSGSHCLMTRFSSRWAVWTCKIQNGPRPKTGTYS